MENVEDNPISIIENYIRELIKTNNKLEYQIRVLDETWEENVKRFLIELIEVVDAFENIFNRLAIKESTLNKETKILVNNFKTVYKLLMRALKSFNVSPIEITIGEKINPYWHKVVETEECLDKENETIIKEIKRGYLWRGKLLRTTEVSVVKNKDFKI